MKPLVISLAALLLLPSCFLRSSKGPIAKESAQLESEGQNKKAEGEKLVREGIDLQNKAKELLILADDNRRQAAILAAQGDTDKATQLRLDADKMTADAQASENEGRNKEAQGQQLVADGAQILGRSEQLEQKGESMPRKTMN
jgi:hypothetical protein